MLFGWPVIPRRRGQKDRFFLSKTQSKFALSTLPSTLLVKALAISLLAWARLICSTAWFPASPSITTCNGFGANSFIAPFDASTPAPMMPPSSRLPAIAVPPPPEIDDIPLVVTVLYPGLLSVMVAQLLRVRPRVSRAIAIFVWSLRERVDVFRTSTLSRPPGQTACWPCIRYGDEAEAFFYSRLSFASSRFSQYSASLMPSACGLNTGSTPSAFCAS